MGEGGGLVKLRALPAVALPAIQLLQRRGCLPMRAVLELSEPLQVPACRSAYQRTQLQSVEDTEDSRHKLAEADLL